MGEGGEGFGYYSECVEVTRPSHRDIQKDIFTLKAEF